MDVNLVVLCGRVASQPEVRQFDSGSRMLRILLTVYSEAPRRRIDIIPVSLWDPPDHLVEPGFAVSDRVTVTGTLQRRFSDGAVGRRMRMEVIACDIGPGGIEVPSCCVVSGSSWFCGGPAG